MTAYCLRCECARVQPAFHLGEIYPALSVVDQLGGIFLELHGRRRYVWVRHFERVQASGDVTKGKRCDPEAVTGKHRQP